VIDRCREVLAPYKVPRYLEYIAAFPRTSSNKVSRRALKAANADLRAGSFDVQDAVWR
jgi:acyl-coenzyme A synthetase/AMP-(fatty) acid ligase